MATKRYELADQINCTGCMACVDSCPVGAIESHINHLGYLYPLVDESKCIGCGKCSRACVVVSKYSYKIDSVPSCYAAWGDNLSQRTKSASGGVFAAMAQSVIEQGGVVVGAIINNRVVEHKVVDSLDGLVQLQGSKYLQSNTSGIYAEVANHLKSGKKVLFSGMGCQVAAMINFVAAKPYRENLLTVDLICGGVPSSLPTELFIDKNNIESITSFRDKSTGWKSRGFKYSLKCLDTVGQELDFGYKNLPIAAFRSHLVNRYSCNDCNFAHLGRRSDLTIADLWGDTLYAEQHYNGLSVVMVHSPEGQQLIDDSTITLDSIGFDFLKYNPRAVYGKYPVLNSRWCRAIVDRSLERGDYHNLEIMFGLRPAPIYTQQFLLRILRRLHRIYFKRASKRVIYSYLKPRNKEL